MADHRDDSDVYWVEPRERAVFPLDGFRVSKSLAKVLRQNRFRVTCNSDFAAVIATCAEPREEHAESWISHRIEASYTALHMACYAHSIECWREQELVGGLYGVAFDRVFCGESMFTRADNASKIALAWLVAAMRDAGYAVLDCQFMTDHLASLGAVAMSQDKYLDLLSGTSGQPGSTIPKMIERYASASSPGKLIAQSLTQTS